MQVLLVSLALVGIVCGDVSHLGYKYSPPKPITSEIKLPAVVPTPQYIAPVEVKSNSPLPALPVPEYIPPVEVKVNTPVVTPASVPATEYIPQSELKVNTPLAGPAHIPQPLPEIPQTKKPVHDGYSYVAPKTTKPVAPVSEELSPQIDVEPAHELVNDGYRYKTVRRIKYRYRA